MNVLLYSLLQNQVVYSEINKGKGTLLFAACSTSILGILVVLIVILSYVGHCTLDLIRGRLIRSIKVTFHAQAGTLSYSKVT